MKQENIYSLRNASGATASEMTHDLSVLGGGDMSAGLYNLWTDGYETGHADGTRDGAKDGALITVLTLGSIYGIYRLVKFGIQKICEAKEVRSLCTAYSAGVADGKREAKSQMPHPATTEDPLDDTNCDTILQMQDDIDFLVNEMEEL